MTENCQLGTRWRKYRDVSALNLGLYNADLWAAHAKYEHQCTYNLNHISRVNILLCQPIRYVDNKLAYFACSLCWKGVNYIYKKITPAVSLFVKAIYVLVYFDHFKTDVNKDLLC